MNRIVGAEVSHEWQQFRLLSRDSVRRLLDLDHQPAAAEGDHVHVRGPRVLDVEVNLAADDRPVADESAAEVEPSLNRDAARLELLGDDLREDILLGEVLRPHDDGFAGAAGRQCDHDPDQGLHWGRASAPGVPGAPGAVNRRSKNPTIPSAASPSISTRSVLRAFQ